MTAGPGAEPPPEPPPGPPPGPPPEPHSLQVVRAESGFAYGAVGAGIHVFGTGVPLYLLENWRPAPQPDPGYLRELPSRMLNARFGVVPFTGRDAELGDLRRWRDEGPRLAVRWLHAPGGQGKTRTAAEFARQSLAAGWKVATATQGPGAVLPPPGSQDLRLDGAAGLVAVVDYADRWPLAHLAWLFSNALFHRTATPARVLLLARSTFAWPAVRAGLADHQAATSSSLLAPLPGGAEQPAPGPGRATTRREMFTAARDSFAAHYGLAPQSIGPPGPLDDPEFGLTLALHIAALVAVDARAAGRRPPPDMAGLTIYLLDREHRHWERLYGDAGHDLDPAGHHYGTPPGTMNRAVFTAALTGAVGRSVGAAVLDSLRLQPSGQRIAADHAVCYPPADPAADSALEPLYPDRIAEDFLALTVPGHPADYPAQPWAAATARAVLGRSAGRGAPQWTPRAVTFLAAAAERWPHLGPACLYPILRADPHLAVEAGSAALTALADIPAVDPEVLQAVAACLPAGRHTSLDPGIAALTARLTRHRLAATGDLAERARLYTALGLRQVHAGLHEEALAATQEAVAIRRRLAASDPAAHEPELAVALSNLADRLLETGRRAEALSAAQEAAALGRRPAAERPAREPDLAAALANLALCLSAAGRHAEALDAAEEAAEHYRRLAEADPARYAAHRARSLDNLALCRSAQGSRAEALLDAEQAVAAWRRLADADAAAFEPDLARALYNLSVALSDLGRDERAAAAAEAAVPVYRRLAQANPAAHEVGLALATAQLGVLLSRLGRRTEAPEAAQEAAEVARRLARANPAAYEPHLARVLGPLGMALSAAGRHAQALAAEREAVALWRRLAHAEPAAHTPGLATSLGNLSAYLLRSGLGEQAREAAEEAVELWSRTGTANEAYAHHAARALNNLSLALSAVGRLPQAAAAAEQAVAAYRRLAESTPAAYEPDVARTLGGLALCLSRCGRNGEALAAVGEAVAAYRRLAERNASAYEPDLARALSNAGAYLAALGQHREAVEAEQQALAIRTGLAQADPAAYELDLATSLGNLGAHLAGQGRHREAVVLAERAVALYRPAAARDPVAAGPELARALHALAHVRKLGGQDLERALQDVEEAVGLYLGPARALPAAYGPRLRACLELAADILVALGRPADAQGLRSRPAAEADGRGAAPAAGSGEPAGSG